MAVWVAKKQAPTLKDFHAFPELFFVDDDFCTGCKHAFILQYDQFNSKKGQNP